MTTASQGVTHKSKPVPDAGGYALQEFERWQLHHVWSCLQATAQGALGCVYSTKVPSTFTGPRSMPRGSKEARVREAVPPWSKVIYRENPTQ